MSKDAYEHKPCICGCTEYEYNARMLDMVCCKNCGLVYIVDSYIVKEPKVKRIKEENQE